jgi:hypothetical protein
MCNLFKSVFICLLIIIDFISIKSFGVSVKTIFILNFEFFTEFILFILFIYLI